MELGTTRVEDYFSYFESVADFKLMSRQPGYMVAQSELAELIIYRSQVLVQRPPLCRKTHGQRTRLGIEIGMVVADLDKAYAAAVKFKGKGWPISTGIVRRPWGVAISASWRRTAITSASPKGIERFALAEILRRLRARQPPRAEWRL